MQKSEVFPRYRQYCKELKGVYSIMKAGFSEDSAENLCNLRGYPIGETCQYDLIKSMNLGYFETTDEEIFKGYSEELGLYSKKGSLLLNNRFIIPVYSCSGDLISLIGYYPDNRKYITLSTPFFSKRVIWFNFRQAYELSYAKYSGFVIVVEGIFDCLSLRAIGLPCIATMGSSVSNIKGEMLKLFKKVLAIPDDDITGRKSLKTWNVPNNTTMLKFIGGTIDMGGNILHCKDLDNFVTWYDEEDVRETLLSYRGSHEEYEELNLGG